MQLLTHIQVTPDLDPEAALAGALTTELHGQVAAMNPENFIVRMHLEAVERFRPRKSWEELAASDVEILQREVAGLPSGIENDDIEELRLGLRDLVPFLDKRTRTIVHTAFQDEILGVRDDDADLPKMTGIQYEKKVQE